MLKVSFKPEFGDLWPTFSFLYNLIVPLGSRVGRGGHWKEERGREERQEEMGGRFPGLAAPES